MEDERIELEKIKKTTEEMAKSILHKTKEA